MPLLFSLSLPRLTIAILTFGLLSTALAAIARTVPKAAPAVAQDNAIAITCDNTRNPPRTQLKKGQKGEPIALFTWYPNYLVPQDSPEALCKAVAQKVQARFQQGEDTFLAFEQIQKEWRVCFVAQAGDGCSAPKSEYLFSLNAAFLAPRCVMESTAPDQCPLNPITRGPVISVPGGTYKPFWWIFKP